MLILKKTTCLAALALSLISFTGRAQKAPSAMALFGPDAAATTYMGPRFPGGPDSLQAVIGRSLRPADPALGGQLFLHLELTSTGAVQKAALLVPASGTPAAQLAKNPDVQTLLGKLVQRLPAWQPGTSSSGQPKDLFNSVNVPLTFGPTTAALPLPYSDETPTFPASANDRRSGVIGFLQKQVRYPAQDLRSGVQGIVYAYFEVSETGTVEQRRIVGTVSPTLDAEVLRVLGLLPNALTPPRQGGRPVRVSYVLPLNFRIM